MKKISSSLKIILAQTLLLTALSLFINNLYGQNLNPNKVFYPPYQSESRDNIIFPKVGNYIVLTADLHTHTVFSDGLVWPTQRVYEAWQGGLDILSITDHIEYRPHKEYLNSDHNTPYNIAKPFAQEHGITLIKGTEITKTQRTHGHFNALFIDDANLLEEADPKIAIQKARESGAFIIWNHPGWAVDTTKINDFHKNLLEERLIDGIEVFNNIEFYPRVLSWAIDYNLTIIATTDVHGYVEKSTLQNNGVDRPMTLILAKDRSIESIRDALDKGRTLAYFNNIIAAKESLAKEFVNYNISLKELSSNNKNKFIEITNKGSVPYTLKIDNKRVTLPKLSSIILTIPNTSSRTLNVVFENIFTYENRFLAHDLQY